MRYTRYDITELYHDSLMYGRDHMAVGFTTIYMQSVHITTNFVSLNPADTTLYDKVCQ